MKHNAIQLKNCSKEPSENIPLQSSRPSESLSSSLQSVEPRDPFISPSNPSTTPSKETIRDPARIISTLSRVVLHLEGGQPPHSLVIRCLALRGRNLNTRSGSVVVCRLNKESLSLFSTLSMSPCNGTPISPEATPTDNSGDSHSSSRGIEGNGNHRCVSQCPSLRHSIQANNGACTCVQRVCCFTMRLSTKTSPKQQRSTKSQGFRGRPWKRLQQARSWTLEDVFTHRYKYKAKSERRRGRKEEARKPYLVTKVLHA